MMTKQGAIVVDIRQPDLYRSNISKSRMGLGRLMSLRCCVMSLRQNVKVCIRYVVVGLVKQNAVKSSALGSKV